MSDRTLDLAPSGSSTSSMTILLVFFVDLLSLAAVVLSAIAAGLFLGAPSGVAVLAVGLVVFAISLLSRWYALSVVASSRDLP